MEEGYIEERIYEGVDFTQNHLKKGENDSCRFLNCDFSNSDLTDIKFLECEFEECNFSLAGMTNTVLRDIKFKGCKMLGLHFEDCDKLSFSVSFINCNLGHSSFYQMKLKKILFKDLKLHEVDFTGCDLSGSVFDNCDLTSAIFENTNIEKSDFRTAFNYSIDPEKNRLKHAWFSLSGIIGLLDRYEIEIDPDN